MLRCCTEEWWLHWPTTRRQAAPTHQHNGGPVVWRGARKGTARVAGTCQEHRWPGGVAGKLGRPCRAADTCAKPRRNGTPAPRRHRLAQHRAFPPTCTNLLQLFEHCLCLRLVAAARGVRFHYCGKLTAPRHRATTENKTKSSSSSSSSTHTHAHNGAKKNRPGAKK